MQAAIKLDNAALADLGITAEQFEEAAHNALRNLTHPESGDPIYFNDVSVTLTVG